MRFIIAMTIALFVALFCTKTIKKHPFVLYACALFADALYAYGITLGTSGGFWAVFLPLMQRCTLAMAFFAIVMFTGTLKDGSALKAKLMPVRRQISIAACILSSCHIAFYANAYIFQIAGIIDGSAAQSALEANLFASLGVSLLVTLLLSVLTATSITAVRVRMRASSWKKVQRLAYLFYALIFIHLSIILVPPAIAGKDAAVESVYVYTVLFAAYALIRARRHIVDKNHPSPAT